MIFHEEIVRADRRFGAMTCVFTWATIVVKTLAPSGAGADERAGGRARPQHAGDAGVINEDT